MPVSDYSGRLNSAFRLLSITAILLGILYFGKSLFIPMSFGILIAVICYPFSKWLESKGLSRYLAVSIVMALVILLFGFLVAILIYEINILTSNQSEIADKLRNYFPAVSAWLNENFGVSQTVQNGVMLRIMGGLENNIGNSVNMLLSATGSTLLSLILIPIFSFLFLQHRRVFVNFLEVVVGEKHKEGLQLILKESVQTYYHFVKGTFIVYCIVGLLNSAGLLLLGIDHAILFGMITAFMTIIPYVGIIISAALPISVALVTKDSLWYAGGVVAVFSVVQYLEANVIYPRIVGQQLNLSTLAVLVTLIAGTILWGIAGMILFVPFAGLLKVVTDRIPEMKALNILLARDEGSKKKQTG